MVFSPLIGNIHPLNNQLFLYCLIDKSACVLTVLLTKINSYPQ